MQISKYIANRKLATDYLKIAYQTAFIHNKMLVPTPIQSELLATHSINYPLTTKQLWFFNNNLNIMRAYQSNKIKVVRKIHQFKKFINLLFTYKALRGYENVSNLYVYSFLITTNKSNYSVSNRNYTYYRTLDNGNNSIAVSSNKSSDNPFNYQIKDNTNNAVIHIHNAVSKLKKRLSRLQIPLKVIDDSLVIKYGDTVNPVFPHVHGILIGSRFNTSKLSNKFSDKLSQYLGYEVNCSVNVLVNKATKAPVVITQSNYDFDISDNVLYSGKEELINNPQRANNPYYPVGFTMLYINKTRDLSFIGGSQGKYYNKASNDLKHWEQLPLPVKQKYVFGTYNSIHIRKYVSDSLHQNINFASKRDSDFGIQSKRYGVRTHVFYQFKRSITKLTKLINKYWIIHNLATASVLINTATIQNRTLTAIVRSQKRILAVREAVHHFKVSYTYHNKKKHPARMIISKEKHSVGNACIAWSTYSVEPFINNFVLNLFNSS